MDLQGVQAVCGDRRVVGRADARRDLIQVHGLLLGPVGDADPAAQVHKLAADAQLAPKLHDQLEQHARRLDKVLRVELVRGDHGVQAEAPHALLARSGVALEQLLVGQAILGLGRLADDRVAGAARPRVIAEA